MSSSIIRVLLALESPMFCELVRRVLEGEPDVEIVGEVADPLDLLAAVCSTDATTVIQSWPESGEMPGIATHLLIEYPGLRIIGISSRSDRIYVCRQEVAIKAAPIGGLEDVLAEIRGDLAPASAVAM